MTVSDYDRCVRQFSDNLYRFVLKSLHDTEQAKDIVQESFLRLWENREAVIDGKEKSYLFTIAYRLVIDTVRAGRRYGGDEQIVLNHSTEQDASYNGLSEVLSRCLDELPPIQKTLVLLRDYEGYSYREMAEMTSLSEAQVKTYIFRARVALKQSIGNLSNVLG